MNNSNPVTLTRDNDGLLTGAGALTLHRLSTNGLVDSTALTLGGTTHVTTSAGYNAYGELENLHASYSGTAIYHQSLARDDLGRITAMNETVQGTSTLYGYRYDEAGRLYGVTAGGDTIARYRYDGNGNRVSFTGATSADTASATSNSCSPRSIARSSRPFWFIPLALLLPKRRKVMDGPGHHVSSSSSNQLRVPVITEN